MAVVLACDHLVGSGNDGIRQILLELAAAVDDGAGLLERGEALDELRLWGSEMMEWS